jgi:5-methylcytosine-specific restriction endonuclease McrBC regulatory subunit McrC
MGFIGINETELTISSRFSKDDEEGRDYFLHYMLQKVLLFNVINFDFPSGKESIHDFLPYLFPGFLREALTQGIYKQYHRREYNDANVRGAINIARHLRINIPFMGKIAYSTREHSADNAVTQLIRHTIEYLSTRPIGNTVLAHNPDTRADVSTIKSVTPDYQKNERKKIITANRRIVNHAYFTKYRPLQQLCLQILNQEKITFGGGKDKIHGLIFDGSWLWEEYLARIFQENHTGITNQRFEDRDGDSLFMPDGKGKQKIIPDFITKTKENRASFIGDAKYKPFNQRTGTDARGDYFQIITYMFRYSCPQGFILYPYGEEDKNSVITPLRRVIKNDVANNKEKASSVIEVGFPIPDSSAVNKFGNFVTSMKEQEKCFVEQIVRRIKRRLP